MLMRLIQLLALCCLGIQSVLGQSYQIEWESQIELNVFTDKPLLIADFNQDGFDDVLAGGNASFTTDATPIVLLISNGDGTLRDGTAEFISSPIAAANPKAVAEDFNLDGFVDVAIFDQGNLELSRGDGGFIGGEPILLLSNGSPLLHPSSALVDAALAASEFDNREVHIKSLTTGDVDNDGDVDMYVESGGSSRGLPPHFLINNGDGTFYVDFSDGRRSQLMITGESNRWRYAKELLVDMDLDGHLDLVMGQLRRPNNQQEELSSLVAYNDGEARFSLQTRYFTQLQFGASRAPAGYGNWIGSADFTGDGNDDLLLGGFGQGGVMLFVGDGTGALSAAPADIMPSDIEVRSAVGVVADLAGDAGMDVAIFSGDGALPVLLVQEGGRLVPSGALETAFRGANRGAAPTTYTWHADAGDIDGDGDQDLLVMSYGDLRPHLMINRGDGTFSSDVSDRRWPSSLLWGRSGNWRIGAGKLADMNGDGHPDLILGADRYLQHDLYSQVVLNDGHGNFPAALAQSLPRMEMWDGIGLADAIEAGDLDGDGRSDLVIAHHRGWNVSDAGLGTYLQILLGQETGFRDATAEFLADQSSQGATVVDGRANSNIPRLLRIQDVDLDGDEDLIAGHSNAYMGEHQPYLYINEGGERLTVPDHGVLEYAEWHGELAYPANLNNDSLLDFVLPDAYPGPDGVYGTADDFMLILPVVGTVSLTEPSQPQASLLPYISLNDGYTYVFTIATWDPNGDGYPDLILGHERGGQDEEINGFELQFIKNNGDRTFTDVTDFHIGNQDATREPLTPTGEVNLNAPSKLTVVDINSDGHLDIVAHGGGAKIQQGPFLYLNDGQDFFVPVPGVEVTGGVEWLSAQAYPIKLDGDGLIDFLHPSTHSGPDGVWGTGDEFGQFQSIMARSPLTLSPNAAPIAEGSLPDVSMPVGTSPRVVDFSGAFSDPDGDDLSFFVQVARAGVVTHTIEGNLLTMAASSPGETTATLYASDSRGGFASIAFGLTVTNEPPSLGAPLEPVMLNASSAPVVMDVSPHFSDPEGETLSFDATVSPAGIVGVAWQGSKITLDPTWPGSATVTLVASDPHDAGVEASFVVEVINEPPSVVSAPLSVEMVGGGTRSRVVLTNYFSEPEGQPLSFTATTSDSSVVTMVISDAVGSLFPIGAGQATVEVIAADPFNAVAAFPISVNVASGVENEESVVPLTFGLLGTYPNPFQDRLAIEFETPENVDVFLDLYDLLGRRVASSSPGLFPPGRHSLILETEDLADGVYLFRLRAGPNGAEGAILRVR